MVLNNGVILMVYALSVLLSCNTMDKNSFRKFMVNGISSFTRAMTYDPSFVSIMNAARGRYSYAFYYYGRIEDGHLIYKLCDVPWSFYAELQNLNEWSISTKRSWTVTGKEAMFCICWLRRWQRLGIFHNSYSFGLEANDSFLRVEESNYQLFESSLNRLKQENFYKLCLDR